MFVIGITGGTASGKTSLVNELKDQFKEKELCVISQDSYYHKTDHLTFEERSSINFDHPDSIDFELLVSHVKRLKKNLSIEQPIYKFKNHNRSKETRKIHPKKILIVEGILVFSYPELLELFDFKIFVDADADERLIRRIHRDVQERGRDLKEVTERYRSMLKPMHDTHIEPTKILADFVISNNVKNPKTIEILTGLIGKKTTLTP